MLKTIAASLLGLCVLAAPSLAASADKATPAAFTSSEPQATVRPMMRHAHSQTIAKMSRHHRHFSHLRTHRPTAALTSSRLAKLSVRHAGPAIKRG